LPTSAEEPAIPATPKTKARSSGHPFGAECRGRTVRQVATEVAGPGQGGADARQIGRDDHGRLAADRRDGVKGLHRHVTHGVSSKCASRMAARNPI
jgi:hypothetical protein